MDNISLSRQNLNDIIMKSNNSMNVTAAEQASDLLFASLFMDMDVVKQTTRTLKDRPERTKQILEVLSSMMKERMPKFKHDLGKDEVSQQQALKDLAMTRVDEWVSAIGNPSMRQYAALSKHWNIPVGDIIKGITPKKIYELLDWFVVGQEDYKRKIATSFYVYKMKCDPSKESMSLPRNNLLVYGPSGSGKTYCIQVLARQFGSVSICIDCSTLVPQGIVGTNVSDYFTRAYMNLEGLNEREKEEKIKNALVLFDEFDKTPKESIINEFLSLIDDKGRISFRESFNSNSDYITIPTNKMMFVFTGVFDGLDAIRSGNSIGFQGLEAVAKKAISSSDLIRYGIKPEIVGRIHSCTTVEQLAVNDLYELLSAKMESPLNDYLNYFYLNDIKITVTDEAKMMLAQKAYNMGLGVRGLKNMISTILEKEMFELHPDQSLTVDEEYIERHIQ